MDCSRCFKKDILINCDLISYAEKESDSVTDLYFSNFEFLSIPMPFDEFEKLLRES
ncbi:hypothetical protein KAZ01_01030 [Candidatus Gracilibacteria bacterium]|nr:hypothetical protein [Candidatus Gracilibacteria bacterium]